MADFEAGGGGGGKHKKKGGSKKKSTKVDMTPMVDLAFLLITFFMLTTTFSKPQTMEVNMPDKKKDQDEKMKVKESKTMVLLLDENNTVFYYTGFENPEVHESDFGPNGIRKVILDKNRQVKQTSGEDAIYIIKATEKANYKNMVDILDEMAITRSTTYAIVDITPKDLELIEKAKVAL